MRPARSPPYASLRLLPIGERNSQSGSRGLWISTTSKPASARAGGIHPSVPEAAISASGAR